MGSLEGMDEAIARGQRYDAALLDSLHTEEHVWAEFQRAATLVCEGDSSSSTTWRSPAAAVEAALRRIEEAGYAVTRIWRGTSGVRADDGLGLAVVENRGRQREGP